MNGKRPVAPEGFESNSRQLAVLSGPEAPKGRSGRSSLAMGLLWCSIGSASIALAPVVANVLVAFGMAVAMWDRGRREQVVVLLAALAVGSVGVLSLTSVYELPMVVLAILVAFAAVRLSATGRMRAGSLLAMAGAAALVMYGTDLVTTSLAGTTISEVYTEMINGAIDANAEGLDLSTTTALLEVRDMVASYWPSLYFATGLTMVVLSLVGARSGMISSGGTVERDAIARYDVPFAVTAIFALGVAVDLIGARLPEGVGTAAMVGANVVMICRIALAQQGLSVLIWWLREHRVGTPGRILVVLAALWLEMSLALTSLVGMFDTVFNFRKIERGKGRFVVQPVNERE